MIVRVDGTRIISSNHSISHHLKLFLKIYLTKVLPSCNLLTKMKDSILQGGIKMEFDETFGGLRIHVTQNGTDIHFTTVTWEWCTFTSQWDKVRKVHSYSGGAE